MKGAEIQSHRSWPPIVSTLLTAVSNTENNTHTHTQNIAKKQSNIVSSAKQQQKIIYKLGYTSVSVIVYK